jgi:hypothetical protein
MGRNEEEETDFVNESFHAGVSAHFNFVDA